MLVGLGRGCGEEEKGGGEKRKMDQNVPTVPTAASVLPGWRLIADAIFDFLLDFFPTFLIPGDNFVYLSGSFFDKVISKILRSLTVSIWLFLILSQKIYEIKYEVNEHFSVQW